MQTVQEYVRGVKITLYRIKYSISKNRVWVQTLMEVRFVTLIDQFAQWRYYRKALSF